MLIHIRDGNDPGEPRAGWVGGSTQSDTVDWTGWSRQSHRDVKVALGQRECA